MGIAAILAIVLIVMVCAYLFLKFLIASAKVIAVLLAVMLVLGFLGYVNAPKWIKAGASYGWKGIKITGNAVKWALGNKNKVEGMANETASKIKEIKKG